METGIRKLYILAKEFLAIFTMIEWEPLKCEPLSFFVSFLKLDHCLGGPLGQNSKKRSKNHNLTTAYPTCGDIFASSFKAQSSNMSLATFPWKETFELWAFIFETAFENITAGEIGCTNRLPRWAYHAKNTSWYTILKYLSPSMVHPFFQNFNSKMVVVPSRLWLQLFSHWVSGIAGGRASVWGPSASTEPETSVLKSGSHSRDSTTTILLYFLSGEDPT